MRPPDIHANAGRRVAFRTIGCKLNQCETAQMQQSFLAQGYNLVAWDDTADVRVINTCTVTAKSDRTCRREIRLAKRLDPGCLVAVTGCYAEVAPQAVGAIPGVDLVLGNAAKQRLAACVTEVLHPQEGGGALSALSRTGAPRDPRDPGDSREPDDPDAPGDEFITHFYGYTRAFLKIQTGCDSHCAYCIIPAARGRTRSMPGDRVLEQVGLLAARDYKEIVLTGINLGSWGRDAVRRATGIGEGDRPAAAPGTGALPVEADGLAGLLRLLLQRTDGVRFRLSSIEPLEMDAAMLEAIGAAGDRVAHHFHLPLQSGSDEILRRMGRPYSGEEYLRIACAIASRLPMVALGADVIVGFPGETEEHFAQTCQLVKESPLTYLHVFSYSDRPGTAASTMADKVHPDVIHERSVHLREIGHELTHAFQKRIESSEQLVLVLRERTPEGALLGLTGNYAETAFEGEDELLNSFVRGTLTGPPRDGYWGLTDLRCETRL